MDALIFCLDPSGSESTTFSLALIVSGVALFTRGKFGEEEGTVGVVVDTLFVDGVNVVVFGTAVTRLQLVIGDTFNTFLSSEIICVTIFVDLDLGIFLALIVEENLSFFAANSLGGIDHVGVSFTFGTFDIGLVEMSTIFNLQVKFIIGVNDIGIGGEFGRNAGFIEETFSDFGASLQIIVVHEFDMDHWKRLSGRRSVGIVSLTLTADSLIIGLVAEGVNNWNAFGILSGPISSLETTISIGQILVLGSACIIAQGFIARGIVVFDTFVTEQFISDITSSALD